MCYQSGGPCECEGNVLDVYRRHRQAGGAHRSAYLAALQALQDVHPEVDAFHSMGLLKDALAHEAEVGFVDCTTPEAR